MSKTVRQFKTALSEQEANSVVAVFYNQNGFSTYDYKGEQWYKKGTGILAGPQIMRVLINQNDIRIEAFTKYALFPGVYICENDLDSLIGALPNKQLKNAVERLIMQLQPVSAAPNPMPVYNSPVQSYNQQSQPNAVANFCAKCGKRVQPGSAFCPNCGYDLR